MTDESRPPAAPVGRSVAVAPRKGFEASSCTVRAGSVAAKSKVRSRVTNNPSTRHGRSPEARRVRDLYGSYMAALGNPVDPATQALALSAAEAVVICEVARRDLLGTMTAAGAESLVRLENTANRSLKRIGLAKAAPKPKGLSFRERLEAAELARTPPDASDGTGGPAA
jgi:hypothetical protein